VQFGAALWLPFAEEEKVNTNSARGALIL